MLTLAKSLQTQLDNHVRGGSKASRKKEVARIIEFLDWVEAELNVRSVQSLGRRQVEAFWKARPDMSDSTAYRYWLGIRRLWGWLDKHEVPPSRMAGRPVLEAKPALFMEPGAAIRAARGARGLSLQNLANMTGIEVARIGAIETGTADRCGDDSLLLFRALGVAFACPNEVGRHALLPSDQ